MASTGGTTDPPPAADRPVLPRWAFWLMLPGLVGPLLIFGFILVTERAHDRGDCPYRELERRRLAPAVHVVEEARSCIGAIEERRYTLERADSSRLLGERRFHRDAFAAGHYRWTATLSAENEVQVAVHNDGHEDVLFREGTADERRKGTSR